MPTKRKAPKKSAQGGFYLSVPHVNPPFRGQWNYKKIPSLYDLFKRKPVVKKKGGFHLPPGFTGISPGIMWRPTAKQLAEMWRR